MQTDYIRSRHKHRSPMIILSQLHKLQLAVIERGGFRSTLEVYSGLQEFEVTDRVPLHERLSIRTSCAMNIRTPYAMNIRTSCAMNIRTSCAMNIRTPCAMNIRTP